MTRDPLMQAFLSQTDWKDCTPVLLAGDASNRTYYRVSNNQKIAVLMDAPPEKGEDVRPFIDITTRLRDQHFSAPGIYASDKENGFLLLEDLGDDLFARVLEKKPDLETQLYAAATDLLVALHKAPTPDLPPYDVQTCVNEANLITNWYLPAILGEVTQPVQARYTDVITDLCADLMPKQPVLVQRDYHAENLLWLPQRREHKRVGLLDYQDALAGHPAYDLVSLLEDARRDTSLKLQHQMLERYMAASNADPSAFQKAYATLGAQRNLKILGIFARLSKRDGKPDYVALMPRVWAHLQHDLAHPALSDLRSWVDAYLPEPNAQNRLKLARQT